ncbi:MAG: DUF2851 family protein [Prevotellaceae bacterium]|jgi:hypothetical protein|nr:DUF2851 family protein [Prevotellaceae bacterium]
MLSEEFLQFIWKFGLFDKENLFTVDGKKVDVVSLGTYNNDAGPDFFNAKLKIENTTWVGNIEVHKNSSDWIRHKHNNDKAYNNVILHVVGRYDIPTQQENGSFIPIVELSYSSDIEQKYIDLITSKPRVACRPFISSIDSFPLKNFLSRVLIERLEVKSQRLAVILRRTNNDWLEAFHRTLFRSFGFSVNAVPFELLAQQTPLLAISKHRDSLAQLEALLFGQAGFLLEQPLDEYQVKLKAEYTFLQNKFKLTPIERHLWKFLRLRPNNFPTIRIAQLAYLLHRSPNLLDSVLSLENINDYFNLFDVKTSNYWETHYNFGVESKHKVKQLGRQSIERIISNTVVPFLFTYGKARHNEELRERALTLLESFAPEKNATIEDWAEAGIKAENAFYSQALLQLKQAYCDKQRCLSCFIGSRMFIQKV